MFHDTPVFEFGIKNKAAKSNIMLYSFPIGITVYI